jgi:hypothetical protein
MNNRTTRKNLPNAGDPNSNRDQRKDQCGADQAGGVAERDLKSLQDGVGNVGVSHTHYTFDDDGSAAFRNKKGSGHRSL